jgi:uncharacterized membrane protein
VTNKSYIAYALFDTETNMAFREKTTWISLLAYLGVYGYYFWTVLRGRPDHPYGGRLIDLIILLAIIIAACQAALALWRPKEARTVEDERERMMSLRATAIAFQVALGGTMTAAGAIALGLPIFWAVNGLILIVVLAEVTRMTSLIVHYRLSA